MQDKIYKDPESDEWFFGKDQYILSETDSNGIILYANEVFCEIAAYTKEELIGEPHNLLRHPDMPKIAFQGLWDDIQSKGFWEGIVKNKRKDGAHYWVHATVLRKIDSNGNPTYLSIRTVPNRTAVEDASKLYHQLKQSE